MSDKSSSGRSGIGFFGLLTIVFITLKLLGITVVATWSWWWVFAPLWLTFVVAFVIAFGIGLYAHLKR